MTELENRGAGFNVLWSYCTDAKKAEIENYIRENKPGTMLLLDTFANSAPTVIDLARRYPETVFIYRKYNGDNVHRRINPTQLCNEMEPFRNGPINLFIEITNEPDFYDKDASGKPTYASVQWQLSVMKEARRRNIRLSVGSYSVGVPEVRPNWGDLPIMEETLRYMALHPGWFVLSLHEYFRGEAVCDVARGAHNPNEWPTSVPANVELHLLGRFRAWLQFCDEKRIARPKIVITECGPDAVKVPALIEAYPNVEGTITTSELWKSWGFHDWQAYGAQMLKWAWQKIYKPYPEVLGICLFCWNDSGEWYDWNFDRAPELIKKVRGGFERMDAQAATVKTYPVGVYTLKTPLAFINLRDVVGNDIGDVKPGDTVEVLDGKTVQIKIGTVWYTCQKVRHNNRDGYIAMTTSFELVEVLSKDNFIAELRDDLELLEVKRVELGQARERALATLAKYELMEN